MLDIMANKVLSQIFGSHLSRHHEKIVSWFLYNCDYIELSFHPPWSEWPLKATWGQKVSHYSKEHMWHPIWLLLTSFFYIVPSSYSGLTLTSNQGLISPEVIRTPSHDFLFYFYRHQLSIPDTVCINATQSHSKEHLVAKRLYAIRFRVIASKNSKFSWNGGIGPFQGRVN